MNGEADFLALGDWNFRCGRCNGKFKASQARRQWQGFYVCSRCWEPRQPQDFVRAILEHPTPPWVQNPAEIFIPLCSFNGLSAVADVAECDCAICDYISPLADYMIPQ